MLKNIQFISKMKPIDFFRNELCPNLNCNIDIYSQTFLDSLTILSFCEKLSYKLNLLKLFTERTND